MGKGGKNIRSKTFRIINVLSLFGHLLLTSYNPDNNFKTKLWINLELKALDKFFFLILITTSQHIFIPSYFR